MNIKDVLEIPKQEFNKQEILKRATKILEKVELDTIFNTPFKWVYKNHINLMNDDRKFFVINPFVKEWEKFISQKQLVENNITIASEVNQLFLSFLWWIISYYYNLYTISLTNPEMKKFININPEKDSIYMKEINLYGWQSNSDYIEPNNSEMYFIYGKNDKDFWVWVNNKEIKPMKSLVIAIKKDFILKNQKEIIKHLINILSAKIKLNEVLKTKDINVVYSFISTFIWSDAVNNYNWYQKEIEKITYVKLITFDKYVTPKITEMSWKGSGFILNVNNFLEKKFNVKDEKK